MPQISVIVPVYNVEEYLHRCVDSILEQTFTNFELILVDDGSSDRCGVICDEYAAKDTRVRVIHQENQGQAAARNHAVSIANGEWIHFVDGDDVIHPEMLSTLFSAAVENDVDISMCFACEGQSISDEFGLKDDHQTRIMSVDEKSFLQLIEEGEHQFWITWAKLIRKGILEKHPFVEGRVYEDNAVVHRWLYEAGRITIVNSRLYFYRINPAGTTKQAFSLRKLDYLWALEEIISTFSKLDYKTLRRQFCMNYVYNSLNYYMLVQNDPRRTEGINIVRDGLRRVLRKNYRYILLSEVQRNAVMEILHPRLMRIYWLGIAAISVLKKDGMGVLVKKVFKRIMKR